MSLNDSNSEDSDKKDAKKPEKDNTRYGFSTVLGLVGANPKLFVPRSECFMIVSENQIG